MAKNEVNCFVIIFSGNWFKSREPLNVQLSVSKVDFRSFVATSNMFPSLFWFVMVLSSSWSALAFIQFNETLSDSLDCSGLLNTRFSNRLLRTYLAYRFVTLDSTISCFSRIPLNKSDRVDTQAISSVFKMIFTCTRKSNSDWSLQFSLYSITIAF